MKKVAKIVCILCIMVFILPSMLRAEECDAFKMTGFAFDFPDQGTVRVWGKDDEGNSIQEDYQAERDKWYEPFQHLGNQFVYIFYYVQNGKKYVTDIRPWAGPIKPFPDCPPYWHK
jgi:1,4-alpha-glucan branching enzyme